MALGKRRSEQQEMWVATTSLPKSVGHVFYRRLNEILAEAGFDRTVEEQCRPYYHGHPKDPIANKRIEAWPLPIPGQTESACDGTADIGRPTGRPFLLGRLRFRWLLADMAMMR